MVNNILITGAAGFIGTNLIFNLVNKKYKIYAVDKIRFDKRNNLFQLIKKKNFKYIHCDLKNYKNFNKINKIKIDTIIHLASGVGVNTYINDPYNLISNIFKTTENIIKFSQFKKAHLVYASTSEIYGKNPKIPWKENDDRVLGSTKISRWSYSSVKSTCEHLIHGTKKLNPSFKFTIVRFFNAYGPYQANNFVISSFMNKILNKKKLLIYDDGKMKRCFTYIDDIILCLEKLINSRISYNETFNIGSNKAYSIIDVKKKIEKILNRKIKFKFLSPRTIYKNKYEDINLRIPNITNIKKKIKWKPTTSLETGLIKYYEFLITKNNK